MMRGLLRIAHRPVYESRLRELVRRIIPHLRPHDRVLDVGCGSGLLGAALLAASDCPPDVQVEGLERMGRGDEPIRVHVYGGGAMPFEDDQYDVVIVADVLHHEQNPDELLAECARVSRRLVVVKDHQRAGPLAQWRISLIDWAANAGYGVKCLYRYNTPEEWLAQRERLAAEVVEELNGMRLYPPVVDQLFGGRLQYMGVWRIAGASG